MAAGKKGRLFTGDAVGGQKAQKKVANRTRPGVEIDGYSVTEYGGRVAAPYSCVRSEKRSPFPYDGPSMTVACNQ